MMRALLSLLAGAALGLLLALLPTAPSAHGATAAEVGWSSSTTYAINYLGRDGPDGSDHYRVTLDWGATFFGIAVQALPLIPVEQAMEILMGGYAASYPNRAPGDIHPGDSFEFYVPGGTVVADQWRRLGNATEYRSLRGDRLIVYQDFRSPFLYRLTRVEYPSLVEVALNPEAALKPYDLARALYGAEDPDFRPDILQVTHAQDVIQKRTALVTIDTSRPHLDDLWELRERALPGGKTEDGMDVYWFRSEQAAQPLFRIDDGMGDRTDPSTFPSPMRVYYYKDGAVRTYVRTSDITFLSRRQPKSESWAKVFSEYGRVDPAPSRWELGQPEQDAAAQELSKLGITVLRFEPKAPPKGNFFTQLLDMLFAMMSRKVS